MEQTITDDIERLREQLKAERATTLAGFEEITRRLEELQRQINAARPPGWGLWVEYRRNGKGPGVDNAA